MASNFSEAPLIEFAAPIPNSTAAGPFGSNLVSRDYVPEGVPVIRGQNLLDRWIGGEFVYVSNEKAHALRTNTARPGDVVFTQRGTLGQVALVPERPFDRYVISQSQMKLSVDQSKSDARFVYYACRTAQFLKGIHDNAVAAGVPHINLGTLRRLAIPCPPRASQVAIADILSVLDNRIDYNRALAANLEAIARALFKSWFVDFDPVRAKAVGEAPPGLLPDLAALFPYRFVDSELGEIPEGWIIKTLDDAFDLNPKRTLPKGTLAQYLDMSNTPTRGHVPDQVIRRVFASGSKFTNGDTLLARITPCLENGKAAFVDFLQENEVGWGSTEFIVMRPKAPLPAYFGYLLARHAAFKAHAISSMSGTSGRQRVQPDSLATWELVVPSPSVGEAFGNIVEPLRASIECAHAEIRVLAQLRDLLLPRLISGKLRVEDAEAALEAA